MKSPRELARECAYGYHYEKNYKKLVKDIELALIEYGKERERLVKERCADIIEESIINFDTLTPNELIKAIRLMEIK